MKKEYKKPTIEVLEMEMQQMICQSTEETRYSLHNKDGEDWDVYDQEFD